MKDLNNFIQEKLKITSKTKINSRSKQELLNVPNIVGNYITDKILYLWGFKKDSEDIEEIGKVIKKWVFDNNVGDVRPAADPETLNDYNGIIPKEILDLYDNGLSMNEECQYRLNAAKEIYSFDKFTQIYAATDIIAIIGSSGTLYCLPEETL